MNLSAVKAETKNTDYIFIIVSPQVQHTSKVIPGQLRWWLLTLTYLHLLKGHTRTRKEKEKNLRKKISPHKKTYYLKTGCKQNKKKHYLVPCFRFSDGSIRIFGVWFSPDLPLVGSTGKGRGTDADLDLEMVVLKGQGGGACRVQFPFGPLSAVFLPSLGLGYWL